MENGDNRLSGRQRAALAAFLGCNFLSGAVHACWGWAAGPEAPAPYILLQIHGWTIPPLLVLIGALLPAHLGPAWRAGRNRGSGAAFAAALILLTLTGFGLYYIGNEALRAACKAIHTAAGLALPLLLAAHILAGGRTRRNRSPAAEKI